MQSQRTPVPGDCIYRVISQKGDRVQFERLATPRPAPKVTLQSNWHTQQQQLTLKENAASIQETCVTRESQAEVRDDPKNATEMELASRILVRAISKVDVNTHLSTQEVISDAFSNKEANTQEIERGKIGSNKSYIQPRI